MTLLHFLVGHDGGEGTSDGVVIGEQYDMQRVIDRVPGELVFKCFYRPVDNAEFASSVTEYLTKADAGEFKKSILVVDDDPQYLTLVREWLKGTIRYPWLIPDCRP